jgi:hypothetical protein
VQPSAVSVADRRLRLPQALCGLCRLYKYVSIGSYLEMVISSLSAGFDYDFDAAWILR